MAPDADLESELERDAISLETDFARERTALLFSGVATLSATDVLMEGVDTARTGWVKDEKALHARQRCTPPPAPPRAALAASSRSPQ